MIKHRGIPGRLAGTNFQFTIRRPNPKGAVRLVARKRHADRRQAERRADEAFLAALWDRFGEEPFPRGNLDAGRLSWMFGREILPAEDPFDPESYDAVLRIDFACAEMNYPRLFEGHRRSA